MDLRKVIKEIEINWNEEIRDLLRQKLENTKGRGHWKE